MATYSIDYSGTGTTQDPYLVYTIEGLLYCIDQVGATVLVVNDLDAKHDPTYRESVPQLNLKCSVISGKAFPYDSSKQYQIGDKCTFNDPDYGNLIYTCKSDCIGVAPTNTEYFNPGESAYVSLAGFKVTGTYFITASEVASCTVTNIFIESGIHTKTAYKTAGSTFQVGQYDSGGGVMVSSKVYYNDCKFSMCISFNGQSCNVDSSSNIYKNRCSEYYVMLGSSIWEQVGGSSQASNVSSQIFCASRYSCTVEFYNSVMMGQLTGETLSAQSASLVNNASYSSFVGEVKLKRCAWKSNCGYLVFVNSSNCFYSVSVSGLNGASLVNSGTRFINASGVSIYNNDTPHTDSMVYVDAVKSATAEQCKDREWLISQGFIVG